MSQMKASIESKAKAAACSPRSGAQTNTKQKINVRADSSREDLAGFGGIGIYFGVLCFWNNFEHSSDDAALDGCFPAIPQQASIVDSRSGGCCLLVP